MHQVDELARALRSYRDGIEYSPDRLHELEERLDLINRLKRKYGSTIGEILAFGERASQELEKLYHREERVEGLKAREMDLRRQVGRLAGQLSEARQHAARGLADAIQEEAARAGFRACPKCLWISVNQTLKTVCRLGPRMGSPYATPSSGGESIRHLAFNGTGIDSVEFLISLNPGEPPRPPGQDRLGGRSLQADARHKDHPIHG